MFNADVSQLDPELPNCFLCFGVVECVLLFYKLLMLPDLLQTTAQLATFKAADKRKTLHQHLFLPKDYSGSPTVSLYTPWTEAEVHDHLTAGWGSGAISDLRLEYLYGPEAESSGE